MDDEAIIFKSTDENIKFKNAKSNNVIIFMQSIKDVQVISERKHNWAELRSLGKSLYQHNYVLKIYVY